MRLRRAQAMLETVLGVLFVTFVLLVSFQLMHMLTARIVLDHAAARAARAKAVGLNDYMCLKSARVAMIPVAGHRLWPEGNLTAGAELARVPLYMSSEMPARARAILDYEYWGSTRLEAKSDTGLNAKVDARILMETDDFSMDGEKRIESHYPLYMTDLGL